MKRRIGGLINKSDGTVKNEIDELIKRSDGLINGSDGLIKNRGMGFPLWTYAACTD